MRAGGRGRSAGLVVGTVLAVAALGPSPAAATPTQAQPDDPAAVVVSPDRSRAARSVLDYWTPRRMADAVPIERLLTGDATGATGATGATDAADEVGPGAERRRVRVPRTAGKLFFTTPVGDSVCSAATINTRRKNQVVTAGHCVHAGEGGGFYRNWVFVPRYHQGRRPYGVWVAKNAYVFRGWSDQGSYAKDQAIIKFGERRGRQLVRVVGGNRMRLGTGVRQRGVRVWGWPAEGRYDGEVARRCEGRTTRWRRTGDAKIKCGMTAGSSGGPWLLRKQRTANKGIIFAVTSRGTIDGRPRYLIARPLPHAMRNLLRAAN